MNIFDTKIESERLVLVPITLDYADDIFRYFTDEVTKYMGPKPSSSIDETKAFISSSITTMTSGTNIQMVILLKDSNEFIGCAGLHDINNIPELGIWIKMSAHGNGYGKEAIHAFYDWACRNIEFDYITYPVDKRNDASRKIPESLGGVVKKEYKHVNQSLFELDEVEYHVPNVKGQAK